MSETKSVVKSLIDQGKTQLEIVTELVRNHDLDIQAAGKAYTEVAKEVGLILDNKQKANLTEEVGAAYTKEGVLDRKEAEVELAEKANISKVTASGRLAAWCKKNEVEFPKASREKRDLDAVKALIKSWHEQQVPKKTIIEGLKEHHGYTDITALDAYRKVGIELGFIEKRSSKNKKETVAWFIENRDLDRKAMVAAMQLSEEDGGLGFKKATAETVWSTVQFAVEYHNQLSS